MSEDPARHDTPYRPALADRLDTARAIVEAVIKEMDNTTLPTCEHCGATTRYANWAEHQAVEQLGAVTGKLKRWAGSFRANKP